MKLVAVKLDAAFLGVYDRQAVLTEMSPGSAEGPLLLHFLGEERSLYSSLVQLYS